MEKKSSPLVGLAVSGARILSRNGHDDFNQGQISFRRPGAEEFHIKQAQTGFNEVAADGFVEAEISGKVTPDRFAPPELPLHQAIYRARPDVGAIVHSHSRACLAFGALERDIEPISHEGALFQGDVAHFTETSNTVLEQRIGEAIADTLSDKIAVFLVNHGSVVVGKSIRHAVVFATMLERAADIQLRLLATGLPYSISDMLDVKAKREFVFADLSVRSYWDHAVRQLSAIQGQ
jgi:L-fuculose-phosphate aldolase